MGATIHTEAKSSDSINRQVSLWLQYRLVSRILFAEVFVVLGALGYLSNPDVQVLAYPAAVLLVTIPGWLLLVSEWKKHSRGKFISQASGMSVVDEFFAESVAREWSVSLWAKLLPWMLGASSFLLVGYTLLYASGYIRQGHTTDMALAALLGGLLTATYTAGETCHHQRDALQHRKAEVVMLLYAGMGMAIGCCVLLVGRFLTGHV